MQGALWSHGIVTQEAESKQGGRSYCEMSRTVPSDSLSPTRLHILKVQQLFKEQNLVTKVGYNIILRLPMQK